MTEEAQGAKGAAPSTEEQPVRDTYAILETGGNVFIHMFGGLFVQGEENVPKTGPILMVSNHSSYLDPVAIGVASPRRVVFMAKAELFDNAVVGYFLRGVDSFPVRRGEADRTAFRTTMSMLQDDRVVCIFPEGTRSQDGNLMDAEPGAALFATRTGCQIVPVYVSGSNKMLTIGGKLKVGKILVTFGEPFTLPRSMDRVEGGRQMMAAIARTRDEVQSPNLPVRQIGPHWFHKPLEGSRARKRD